MDIPIWETPSILNPALIINVVLWPDHSKSTDVATELFLDKIHIFSLKVNARMESTVVVKRAVMLIAALVNGHHGQLAHRTVEVLHSDRGLYLMPILDILFVL